MEFSVTDTFNELISLSNKGAELLIQLIVEVVIFLLLL